MRSRDPSSSSVVGGHVAPGFEVVREAFEENFAREGEVGAAFAAWVDGVPAVDLWAGLADRRRGMPWGEDTLVGVFSGTKGLVATCLLLLLERQLLDLDAPVCRYWPEFGAAGKEGLLVRDLVSHQAGLPGLLTPVTIEGATDDVRISQLLADQAPITAPPDGPIYHALTFGWLCGALIRHLDGRTVGRFLAEEVAAPLGLEVWIGLPDRQEQRVAVIERSDAFERKRDDVAGSADEVAWTIWGNPPRFAGADLAANSRAWHAAEVPATNGIVSVRSLARLYGCLARGGEIDGVRLVSEPTVTAARRCLSRGYDPYLETPIAFGTGFQLQTSEAPFGPPADAFGHAGAGGSIHGAWPRLRTGFSYGPNLLGRLSAADPRAQSLLAALHAAVRPTVGDPIPPP